MVNLLKNPPFVYLSSLTGPLSTIFPFSITTTLSNKSMFSRRCVITSSVLFWENLKICSCKSASVYGSMFDEASSRHMISVSRSITRRKFTICFSPFDRFSPPFSIIKSRFSPYCGISTETELYSCLMSEGCVGLGGLIVLRMCRLV